MSSTARSAPETSEPVDVIGRHRRLFGRTLLVSLATFTSRVLGFVREILSAALFGDASPLFDAFVTAWRVPNLFRRFLGEGALSTALQTSLTEVDAERGEAAGRGLFLGTLRTLAWVLLCVCAVVMVAVWFLPDRMPITGAQWLGPDPDVVRELTVRMMPFVILVCVSAVCTGALHVRGHFTLPALAPVAMNIVWIGALFVIAWHYGWRADVAGDDGARQLGMVRWLSASVLVGGVVLVLVQLPALFSKRLITRTTGARPVPVDPGPVWRVLKRTAPLALGAAIYQINVMVDGLMAIGLLPAGGPTAHYMATRLQQLPMALAAIAATSAVFPALTALGHRRELGALRALHDRTQLGILLFALPATVGLVVLSEPIVTVCLQHGAFGPSGVARTSSALRWLAFAIVPAGAVGLVARCYYALGDFKTPVRVSVVMLFANIALNAVFILALHMDVAGLALSTAITSWGNLVWLTPGLRRRLALPGMAAGSARTVLRALVAAAGCGAVAWGVERWTGGSAAWTLVGAILAGVVAYALIAQLLGLPVWRTLRGRTALPDPAQEDATKRRS